MTKPLYEISDDMRSLELLAEEGEIDQQTLSDTMEGVVASFDDKAIAIVHVSTNLNAGISAIDDEITRLTSRKKTIENKVASLKDYLLFNMESSEIKKIQHDLFTITVVSGRDIVEIDDVEKIPTDYLNIKTSFTPMKREILAELKAGTDIPGAILIKSKSSIRIK